MVWSCSFFQSIEKNVDSHRQRAVFYLWRRENTVILLTVLKFASYHFFTSNYAQERHWEFVLSTKKENQSWFSTIAFIFWNIIWKYDSLMKWSPIRMVRDGIHRNEIEIRCASYWSPMRIPVLWELSLDQKIECKRCYERFFLDQCVFSRLGHLKILQNF